MVPFWYWFVSGMLLIWNMIGCAACYGQLAAKPEAMAKWPEAQCDAVLATPALVKFAYILSVGAGLLGAVALLLRSAAAGPLFIASLIGVIVQFGWTFVIYKGLSRFGAASILFPAFIAAVAIGQIAFARAAGSHGWLS